MLDKSYTKTFWDGNKVVVLCRLGTDPTLSPVELFVEVRAADEYQIVASLEGCKAKGADAFAAFEDLQSQLLGRVLIFCCCGNCQYFQLTGLTRQMSSGENGYCLLYMRDYGRNLNDVVAIFDYCDYFEYGPRALSMGLIEQFKNENI